MVTKKLNKMFVYQFILLMKNMLIITYANDKYFRSAHHLNLYKTQFFYENS